MDFVPSLLYVDDSSVRLTSSLSLTRFNGAITGRVPWFLAAVAGLPIP